MATGLGRALGPLTVALILAAGPAGAKSIQQCNAELIAQRGALAAAGESAQAFFHRCWTGAQTSGPTPIDAHRTDWDPRGAPTHPPRPLSDVDATPAEEAPPPAAVPAEDPVVARPQPKTRLAPRHPARAARYRDEAIAPYAAPAPAGPPPEPVAIGRGPATRVCVPVPPGLAPLAGPATCLDLPGPLP